MVSINIPSLKGEARRFLANFNRPPSCETHFNIPLHLGQLFAHNSMCALFYITQLLAMALRINLEYIPNGAVNNISPKCCQYPTGKGAFRFALLESAQGCSKASLRPWMKELKGIIHGGEGAFLRCPVSTSVQFSLRDEGSTEYMCVRGKITGDNIYRCQSACPVVLNDFDLFKENKTSQSL